jgi:aspartate aminotransferase-like enzyme
MTSANIAPPEYRLRIPGPCTVPERVRAALARPVVSHRGPEFRGLMREVTARLRDMFVTRDDVFLIGASGTAAMEASLANILSPGDRLLIAVNGQFGERFVAIAKSMGAQIDELAVPWGEVPEPAAVAERVKAARYRAVVCVHNETSTGTVADIAAIGAALRDSDTLLVVDAVSSIGGMALRMDDWGIDIAVAASQKALMCPPGLAPVAVSRKAMRVAEQASAVPRFFLDFRRIKASLDKDETPFTPPVSLIFGLREALAMIDQEGLANVLARHARLSAALQAGCMALGLPMFQKARPLSTTTTVAVVPHGLDGGDIVRHMRTRYGTVIASQRTRLDGRVIRFGTMGALTEGDILTDLYHLECTLRDLDHAPEPGAGVAAAAKYLAPDKRA